MKIIPAILTDDPKDLELKIRQSESFIDVVQMDIMDGRFVPSRSIAAADLAKVKTNLFLEAHLMVEHPLKEIIPFKDAGVKRIIFHFESKDEPREVIREIRKAGLEAGLAINPETSIEQVEPLLEEINLLLLLAVNPGFYGSKFIPEVLEKSRILSPQKRNYVIALDGGIKIDNILEVRNAGIEVACVGSGIFGKGESRENYLDLLQAIKPV
jgi:ribulose-phosphate 3-epimerase